MWVSVILDFLFEGLVHGHKGKMGILRLCMYLDHTH